LKKLFNFFTEVFTNLKTASKFYYFFLILIFL